MWISLWLLMIGIDIALEWIEEKVSRDGIGIQIIKFHDSTVSSMKIKDDNCSLQQAFDDLQIYYLPYHST